MQVYPIMFVTAVVAYAGFAWLLAWRGRPAAVRHGLAATAAAICALAPLVASRDAGLDQHLTRTVAMTVFGLCATGMLALLMRGPKARARRSAMAAKGTAAKGTAAKESTSAPFEAMSFEAMSFEKMAGDTAPAKGARAPWSFDASLEAAYAQRLTMTTRAAGSRIDLPEGTPWLRSTSDPVPDAFADPTRDPVRDPACEDAEVDEGDGTLATEFFLIAGGAPSVVPTITFAGSSAGRRLPSSRHDDAQRTNGNRSIE